MSARTAAALCDRLLAHDFIHYAVEGEAGIRGGFWGTLAGGRTLAEMNDWARVYLAGGDAELAAVERLVGALSGAAKGRPAAELVQGLARYAASLDIVFPRG